MGGSVVMDPQAAEPVEQAVEAWGELLALGTDSEATVAQTWLPMLRCPQSRSWQHSEAWASTMCMVVSTVAGNPCPVRATCRSSCDDVVGSCGSAGAEAEPSRGASADMDP